eukprot:TRINITY_DN1420_c1_g1_i1.p1 TRINITY_DN1420_c1_g1~~TRINITY_DN1420_c1_g1_i1.p1  ORF type:complete len:439 (+),score=35.63 TRINITY_DN1420_c1_g1_i1:48-1364(+)
MTTMFAAPSAPFKQTKPPDVCFIEDCHPPRSTPFQPDDSFYNSECCEGLWVCCSKNAAKGTLEQACALVRSVFPLPLRRKFLEFRSPKWALDPGPMRLVILASNEQAGCIPEVTGTPLEDMNGANHTYFPWTFSNENDFRESNTANPNKGVLTIHECTHAADGVIRQQIDPYFHEHVQLLYNTAIANSHDGKPNWSDRGTSIPIEFVTQQNHTRKGGSYDFGGRYNGGLYAMANRDEYLAETHCMLRGMTAIHGEPPEAVRSAVDFGMCTPDGLSNHDPGIHALLLKYFSPPDCSVNWPVRAPDCDLTISPTTLSSDYKTISATRWRIRTQSTHWAWDIQFHRWIWASQSDCKIFFSGCAGPGYAATPFWGGRQDDAGVLWLGIESSKPTRPTSLFISQHGGHAATNATVEYQTDGGLWISFASFQNIPQGEFSLDMN